MNEIRFEKLVNRHFNFLVTEHGYKINFANRSEYPDLAIEDGEAEIVSKRTSIYIMKSRWDYLFTIRPLGEPEFASMTPLGILKLFELPVDVLLEKIGSEHFEEFLSLNAQIISSQPCKRFVDGDFSHWLDNLDKYIKEFEDDYFRRNNKKMPEQLFKRLEEYIYVKRMQGHYP
ncbi:MAG: hypothetical protein IPJ47_01765 [Anaerolineales bacterium]|nr:hypothetical protein [Anaerolineales bacterium]